MFEQDNSITPILQPANYTPSKKRKYETVLLNGFKGQSDCHTVAAIVKDLYPNLVNVKQVSITVGLGDCEPEFAELIKLFNGKDLIPVIKTVDYADGGDSYRSLNVAKTMCNYLLRDPESLDIPLIVLDFGLVPESAKFMNDTMISHYSESLMPIRQTQMEITRRRNFPSGGLIELPVKLNTDTQ